MVDALGGGGRIPVLTTFDRLEYRGSVVTMGSDQVIGVLQRIRADLGKAPGDAVHVTLTRDTTVRTVTVPDDLRAALDGAGALTAFDALSYSHRREYVEWVEEAKRPATRERRISETVTRVTES